MTTTTRMDNGGGPDDPYLSDMERQAQQLAQTGQRLIQTVRASAAQPQYPQAQLHHLQTQQPQDVEAVSDSGRGDLAIALAYPRPGAARVQQYLQRQIATAACFLVAASLVKKLPLVWEHRQVAAAAALFLATLILNATGAKQAQDAGERLCAAVELGERESFHKHLQILLLHRESRYLILLEAAIGMLLADAFATGFLK